MLTTVDDDPARGPEGPGHGENLARWPRDYFRLEPAMFVALARMQLPGDIGGDSAQIPDQHIGEWASANRAAHWGSDIDPIAGGRRCHGKSILSGDPRQIAWTVRDSGRDTRDANR